MAAAMAGGGQAAPLTAATAAAPALLPGAAVADAVGQGPAPGGVGGLPLPPKADMSPLLQQLNLESIRTRTQDLFNAISAILQSFQTIPQHRWYPLSLSLSFIHLFCFLLVWIVHAKVVSQRKFKRPEGFEGVEMLHASILLWSFREKKRLIMSLQGKKEHSSFKFMSKMT
jgi:hypothetical protein